MLPSATMRILLVCLFISCAGGCSGDSNSDRQALFDTVTSGSLQHDHPCQEVRAHEASVRRLGSIPIEYVSALQVRIDQAPLENVTSCLIAVQAYDECFRALSCNAFTDTTQPAWMMGSEAAPCGCGVEDRSRAPFGGPRLPASLSACINLLPIGAGPPKPGVPSCNE